MSLFQTYLCALAAYWTSAPENIKVDHDGPLLQLMGLPAPQMGRRCEVQVAAPWRPDPGAGFKATSWAPAFWNGTWVWTWMTGGHRRPLSVCSAALHRGLQVLVFQPESQLRAVLLDRPSRPSEQDHQRSPCVDMSWTSLGNNQEVSCRTFQCPLQRGHSKKQESSRKNIYFCFIDYAKAFDCVDHNKLENS